MKMSKLLMKKKMTGKYAPLRARANDQTDARAGCNTGTKPIAHVHRVNSATPSCAASSPSQSLILSFLLSFVPDVLSVSLSLSLSLGAGLKLRVHRQPAAVGSHPMPQPRAPHPPPSITLPTHPPARSSARQRCVLLCQPTRHERRAILRIQHPREDAVQRLVLEARARLARRHACCRAPQNGWARAALTRVLRLGTVRCSEQCCVGRGAAVRGGGGGGGGGKVSNGQPAGRARPRAPPRPPRRYQGKGR